MTEKSNINLKNLAEIKNGGFYLAIKKGLNELLHRKKLEHSEINDDFFISRYEKKLSVIICTSNRSELSANATEALLANDFDKEKYEIILVNNSSYDYPYKPFLKEITLVNEPILGLSRARNTGAKAASGEYLLFIDDDTEAYPDLLKNIFDAFERNKKVAIIGGQIKLKLPEPTPGVFLEGKESIWSGYTVNYKQFKEIKEQYEFPYGACFGIRHSILDVLGGFSEKYGRVGNNYAGGEETALCFSAQKLGLKIGIEPNAKVLHCVEESRFTNEHIRRTVYEGIITTYRLICDGLAPYNWNEAYINERIKILKAEADKMKKRSDFLGMYYKECELSAFSDIKNLKRTETNAIPSEK